jgi:hemolysin activation/secretion protein
MNLNLSVAFYLVASLLPVPLVALSANPTPLPPDIPTIDPKSPSTRPIPEPQTLPPIEDLLPSRTPTDPTKPFVESPETITVKRFEFVGNTAFSAQELATLTQSFLNRPLTPTELFGSVPTAVTNLYIQKGYETSGAIVPEQSVKNGVVTVQIIEGELEAIEIQPAKGSRNRLNQNYIRSRLALATRKPVNRQRLLEALQILQLNPLITRLNAELTAGSRLGSNLLKVSVVEADTFGLQIGLDNNRSPSVGSFRRQLVISEANLLGFGDDLNIGYANTDGSNTLDLSYTFPINPRNGTLNLSSGVSFNNVIEAPFTILDIQSKSSFIELTYRQPVLQTPNQEVALGVTASRRFSAATLVDGEIPFPSSGSDAAGKTRVTSLRFFQEWSKRNSRSAIALRSQFSLGLNALGATINEEPPDGRFFAWRGQAQQVSLLAPDTFLVLRGDVQLASRSLVPFEQFGLGGQQSVRGYRQDVLLSDNGLFASAEVRVPILRLPKLPGLLQVAPFVEAGTAWNRSRPDLDPQTIASVGLGLRFQVSNNLLARLDWGIPLVSIAGEKRTWQENGVYFSIVYTPF